METSEQNSGLNQYIEQYLQCNQKVKYLPRDTLRQERWNTHMKSVKGRLAAM